MIKSFKSLSKNANLLNMVNKMPASVRRILASDYLILLRIARESYKVEVKLLRNLNRNRNPRKLNIGGGRWFKMGWLNLDYYVDDAFIDIKQNLLRNQSLPFPDESLEVIFTSHVLEHLTDGAVLNLLRECYRTLKRKAIMRIVVPDMGKAFEAYRHGDRKFFFESAEISLNGNNIERRLVNFFASFRIDNYGGERHYSGGPIVDKNTVEEAFNSLSKYEFIKWCVSKIPGDAPYVAHRNGFDYEKMERLLKDAGFREVRESSYKNSMFNELRRRKFDHYPIISLHIEAIK